MNYAVVMNIEHFNNIVTKSFCSVSKTLYIRKEHCKVALTSFESYITAGISLGNNIL